MGKNVFLYSNCLSPKNCIAVNDCHGRSENVSAIPACAQKALKY